MKPFSIKGTSQIFLLVGSFLIAGAGFASSIYCSGQTSPPAAKNYMALDSSQVSQCLGSGLGNIGNGTNDDFLSSSAGSGFSLASDTDGSNPFGLQYTQGTIDGGSNGTWSFDQGFWDNHTSGAIGFKFGTGGTPDQWFVLSLQSQISAGDWTFYNLSGSNSAAGLSHMVLYDPTQVTVPEPGTMGLSALGLIIFGLGFYKRRGKLS